MEFDNLYSSTMGNYRHSYLSIEGRTINTTNTGALTSRSSEYRAITRTQNEGLVFNPMESRKPGVSASGTVNFFCHYTELGMA